MSATAPTPTKISVGIIGAGAAGLITAHTLLEDGFDVQLITRDKTTGGIWSEGRVYPGLTLNNVYGEYHFPSLPMKPPANTWVTGEDLKSYMQDFTSKFLDGRVRYQTEVLELYRDKDSWVVQVENLSDESRENLLFDKIVLCTGGCSKAKIPDNLSPSKARQLGFTGPIFHSSKFREELDGLLKATEESGHVVVVGGGKSAQDHAAYLATQGRKVTVVYDVTDAFLAAKKPLPDLIRRSRFLSILAGNIDLSSSLERFLHTTWFGAKITHFIWNSIVKSSFDVLEIPKDSPLRACRPIFDTIHVGDVGVPGPESFHVLVNQQKITAIARTRVTGYDSGDDGKSITVKLNNGTDLNANAVILCTGYDSSWAPLFSKTTAEELGILRHPPSDDLDSDSKEWSWKSLGNRPEVHNKADEWTSSIYRGIVPAKNILKRDVAANGAVIGTHNGYIFTTTSHWISSYFLNDQMYLPDPETARLETEREARFIQQRYPGILHTINETYSTQVKFWTWPHYTDQLLEDMGLKNGRSGGNWFTWPFKVMDVKQIATLGEERRERREKK